MLIIIKNVKKLYFNEISTFLAKVCEVYGERTWQTLPWKDWLAAMLIARSVRYKQKPAFF